ncbi:MAG: hypothetical protein KXJ52_00700 [Sediminibacterium sp.]|jgi:hypothetical protein|uniref:hypothetical protein n=1 Tax=Sediminibacterium sp. TaxID=1917865 RepID=UPI001D208B02|nr:hypothetical protein [Sediminibacterium sp.]MBW0162898.1 hypothetical protein [Sediminibacterium sp.]
MKKFTYLAVLILISHSTLLSCASNASDSEKTSTNSEIEINEQVIKGISAASLYEPLKQKGFTIDKQIGADAIFVNCSKESRESAENLRIAGSSPEKIQEIRASYTSYTSSNINDLAKPFLGFISTLPYEDSTPEKAKEWLEKNISKNSKITINGVDFEIFANSKNIRTLLITPKK